MVTYLRLNQKKIRASRQMMSLSPCIIKTLSILLPSARTCTLQPFRPIMEQKEFSDPPPHPMPDAIKTPERAKPWYPIAPGIWELLLNSDSREKSVLQWYEPGAKSISDEIIMHTYIEEVVFLEGGLEDVTLKNSWGKGAYAYRKPGMRHGPYRAREDGCLQFVKTKIADGGALEIVHGEGPSMHTTDGLKTSFPA